MPVFLAQAAAMIGGTLVTMAGQLMTGPFLKRLIVQALEVAVKKSATQEDDKLLKEAKRAWNME
jgi:hypothetical protein